MSADKRSQTGFKSFAGKINHDTNLYEFPTLYKTADSGKKRQWTIYVRLIKEESKNPKLTKKQNWNLLEENEVPIKDDYLEDNNKLPKGIVSQIWTETGLVSGHISRSASSYPKEKNVGKSNERNYFHQALLDARSKYLKKIAEGSHEEGKEQPLNTDLYFPMLARNYEDYENKPANHKDVIKYPLYIQPKLDGSRCIAYIDCSDEKELDNMTFENVILYTRQKKYYPDSETNNNIRKSLLNVLKYNYNRKHKKSVYIDGEIYCHGMSLQDIGSETRATDSNAEIQYWIYDCFYPFWKKETFSQRIEFLENLYDMLKEKEKIYIKLTPTEIVNNIKENNKKFKYYLNNNYEGIMIRSTNGIYSKSAIKKSTALRSKHLLKRKKVYDGEYEVIDFTEGKRGTSKGAVIWICITEKGKRFNVTPNETNEERYRIFKECKKNKGQGFIKKYKNRMMLVEYRSLTNAGKPSHAKAIAFRDYE